jgi:hypothetical protein
MKSIQKKSPFVNVININYLEMVSAYPVKCPAISKRKKYPTQKTDTQPDQLAAGKLEPIAWHRFNSLLQLLGAPSVSAGR